MIPVDETPDRKTARERAIGRGITGSMVMNSVDSILRNNKNKIRETAIYV